MDYQKFGETLFKKYYKNYVGINGEKWVVGKGNFVLGTI